jgi:hypothetical protein
MIIFVTARKEADHGDLFRIERRHVGGKIGILLQNEIEASGEIHSQHLYAIRIYDIEIRTGGRGKREE